MANEPLMNYMHRALGIYECSTRSEKTGDQSSTNPGFCVNTKKVNSKHVCKCLPRSFLLEDVKKSVSPSASIDRNSVSCG